MSDRTLIYAAAFLRSLAIGMAGVLAGLHLAATGLDTAGVGAVVAAGLGGAAAFALFATLWGDRLGRKRVLIALSLLSAVGGVVVALGSGLLLLAAAAFLGMLNGMGRDRGAALILEQAMLPATTDERGRTRAFAWYNVAQDAGHALGGLAAGLAALLRGVAGAGPVASLRISMVAYATLCLAGGAVYVGLSPLSARPPVPRNLSLAPECRRLLARISALFGLDSLAGGFLTTALLSLFFHQRFGVGEVEVGALFFGARILNALSHLAAAWLAARIGLLNTMVFTHAPSSVLLVTVAFAPSFPVAAALFLLREGLVEMDVPTRQSYVLAVVRPEERTVASGVTHLVRLGAWAVAPAFAGLLMVAGLQKWPLVIGAAMKLLYDFLLWQAFRHVRPPEEMARSNLD
jgi:MFS family permease